MDDGNSLYVAAEHSISVIRLGGHFFGLYWVRRLGRYRNTLEARATRLKQIIKEEVQKSHGLKEGWGDHREKLIAATLKKLQENDVLPTGKWEDPAGIIAFAVDDLNSTDEQDHMHFIEEVIETHNSSEWAQEMGGIGVDIADVMEARQADAEYWNRHQDL